MKENNIETIPTRNCQNFSEADVSAFLKDRLSFDGDGKCPERQYLNANDFCRADCPSYSPEVRL